MGESNRPDGRTELLRGPAAEEERIRQFRPAGTGGGGLGAGALAVAALAVGVLACSFSWMFFIQRWIVLAGAVAAVLGLAGVLVARRGAHSPTLAAAGAVLGVLSIVAVFTTEAVARSYVEDTLGGLFSDVDSGPGASAPPTDFPLPTDTAEPPFEVPPGSPGGTPPPPAGDLAPTNSDAPLPVGQSGELSGWTVTVTSVITDAAEAIQGGGNPPPANGRYVLVELTATNTGELTGGAATPVLDVGLAGSDGLEYRSFGCYAVLDQPPPSAPLQVGETASWQACIDITPDALEIASLFVSSFGATREERVYWQLS